MKYLVEVFWSDDDEGYIAVVPDLPGCSEFGARPEAAVHEIGAAVEAWITACRGSGDPIPEPTTKARRAARCYFLTDCRAWPRGRARLLRASASPFANAYSSPSVKA